MENRTIYRLILIILFTTTPTVIAQGKDEIPLQKKMIAFQYQVGSNFSLDNYSTAIVTFKYHIADKSAIKVSIDARQDISKVKKVNGYGNHRLDRLEVYDFNVQFIQYLYTVKDVSLFAGGGVKYQNRFRKNNDPTTHNIAWGLTTTLGLEWFFRHNMSLSIESGLFLSYETEKVEVLNQNKFMKVSTYNILSEDMTKFGISIYF